MRVPPRVAFPILLAAALLAVSAVACSDDDDPPAGEPTASGGGPPTVVEDDREGGPELSLEAPASQYAPLLDDIGPGYFTDLRQTFSLTVENYSTTSLFSSEAEGTRLLTEWGYLDGYETGYEPERRELDVLAGNYYVSVEVHLFADTDGSHGFYSHIAGALAGGRSQPLSTAGVANESGAWFAVDDEPVPGSDIAASFHWFLFRRGNMVAFVRTWGSQPLMKIDAARQIAIRIDDKALGDAPRIIPTPVVFDTPEPTPEAEG